MPECRECGGTEFDENDGFHFCQTCLTQSQDFLLLENEEEDVVPSSQLKKKATDEEDPRKTKNYGRPWHTYEAFTIIIREQVKALVELGASPRLHDVVFQLWCNYLSKTGIAFPEDESKIPPEILKHTRSREKYPPTVESPLIQPVKWLKTMKRKHGMVTKATAEKDIEKQNLTMSLKNVEFYEGDNPTDLLDDQEEVDGSTEEDEELPEFYTRDIMKEKPEYMTMTKTLCFCYIGMMYTDNLVVISDIMRWADQRRIPYYKPTLLLPDNMQFTVHDTTTFSVLHNLSYEIMELESAKLVNYLRLTDIPEVSLLSLASKYIVMLDLPGELHGFVATLIHQQDEKGDRRHKDLLAMGYIITTLQLLLDLDDVTERELSNIATELNELFSEKYNLFVWTDWIQHISSKIKPPPGRTSQEDYRDVTDVRKYIKDLVLLNKEKRYAAIRGKTINCPYLRPDFQAALQRPLQTLEKVLKGNSSEEHSVRNRTYEQEYDPDLDDDRVDYFLNDERSMDHDISHSASKTDKDYDSLEENSTSEDKSKSFRSSSFKYITQPYSFKDDLDNIQLSKDTMSMSSLSSEDENEFSEVDMFEYHSPRKRRKREPSPPVEMDDTIPISPQKDLDDTHAQNKDPRTEKLQELTNRLVQVQESSMKIDNKTRYNAICKSRAYQCLLNVCSTILVCPPELLEKKIKELQKLLFTGKSRLKIYGKNRRLLFNKLLD